MAQEIRQFQVTTPAGVVIAAPQVTSLAMPAREVTHLRVRVPPGPRGNLGWAVAMAETPVIPVNTGAWIVGDDEVLDWDLEGLPNSGAWQLFTYNLGKLPHTVYLSFSLRLVQNRLAGAPTVPLVLVP